MHRVRKIGLIIALTTATGLGGRLLAQTQVAPSVPWAHLGSDLPADPAVRFGTLPNGMRYALRRNATPPGQIALRMRIDAGSLMEKDDERGLAHFMEHMAFNGTSHLPEAELGQILERQGLKFGSDTNAFTGFDETVFQLDLPRNSDESVDTGLHILREQVSEALLRPAAIDAERGVIAGEARLRDGPDLRVAIAKFQLIAPRLAERLPIGDPAIVRTAPRERLLGFYNRYYRPSHATLVVVGDFDVDKMEAKVRGEFADWVPRGPDAPTGAATTVIPKAAGVKVLVQPGVDPSVELIWTGAPDLSPDSRAKESQAMIRQLGQSILLRRMQELSRTDRPPLVSASVNYDEQFRMVRSTALRASYNPGGLDRAVAAVEQEQRRIVRYGVSKAELTRQIAVYGTQLRNLAAGAATLFTPSLASEIASDVNDREVTTSPQQRLDLFDATVKNLTPPEVDRAVRGIFEGNGPLVLVTTPTAVAGGEAAVGKVLAASRRTPVSAPAAQANLKWPYTDFGVAGTVASRKVVPEFDATLVTFANGSTLAFKHTALKDKEVLVSLSTGLGEFGMSADRLDPIYGTTTMLADGGLGKLTRDEEERVLTGHAYEVNVAIEPDRFIWSGKTRPEDLQLQMQLLTAHISDPGLRTGPWDRDLAQFESGLAHQRATPMGVFGIDGMGLLAGGDRRATVPTLTELREVTMDVRLARLRKAIAQGPIDVVVVGDVSVDDAIAAVASTVGALPPRGPASVPPAGADRRKFPVGGGPIVRLHHTGQPDQSLALVGWPAPDAADNPGELQRAQVMAEVLNLRVLGEIRERQGLSYSPGAGVGGKIAYHDGNYFVVLAQTTPDKIDTYYGAVDKLVRELQAGPVTQDELDRARLPLISTITNTRVSNAFWAAQLKWLTRRPRLVEEYTSYIPLLQSLTPADIQAMARKYLTPDRAWRATVEPK